MAFRTSLGDFDVDSFSSLPGGSIIIAAWIIWLIAVIISNIIFMNFLIAVISESYEKIMQKMTSQTYKGKVDLIYERESQFKDEDLNNPQLFPRYIVLRRLANSDSQADEWQGFIKDLKSTVKNNTSKVLNFMKNSQEKNYKV